MDQVFISYAREDWQFADRLYMDLRHVEINAWLDSRCLLPGQNWRREIPKVIRESTYFIALISKNSLSKRGYVQRELKSALEVLKEIPNNDIFLIPVRIDETIPYEDELTNLNWVDLFSSYSDGLRKILTIFKDLNKKPLEYLKPIIDTPTDGNDHIPSALDLPIVGSRQPISYSPYKKFSDYIKEFIEKLPKNALYSDSNYKYYFMINTKSEGIFLPQFLIDRYPNEIILVFLHQFEGLAIFDTYFTVDLWFSGLKYNILITYESIIQIIVPNIGLKVEKIV